MSKITLISHEKFPEDAYVKELAYLEFDEKYRVAYLRKQTKTGGMFWSEMTSGITVNGQKKFYSGFIQDSKFDEMEINKILNALSENDKKPEMPSFDMSAYHQLPF